MCGEKVNVIDRLRTEIGSPPRVRGKEGTRDCLRIAVRITPACAGKRSCARSAGRRTADHPRVCGEKSPLHFPLAFWRGSPPRVRGKATKSGIRSKVRGITPACAGKRQRLLLRSSMKPDHPRVCGEKTGLAEAFKDHEGSPPRVRGKDVLRGVVMYAERITPACAGKSICTQDGDTRR